MSAEPENLKEESESLLSMGGPSEQLANHLLAGKLIRYTDNRFQVSSGECKFILKLIQDKEKFILFYAQIPYIYPIPDDLKSSIKFNLETVLNTAVNIEFINAGAQAQRKNLNIAASMMGD